MGDILLILYMAKSDQGLRGASAKKNGNVDFAMPLPLGYVYDKIVELI